MPGNRKTDMDLFTEAIQLPPEHKKISLYAWELRSRGGDVETFPASVWMSRGFRRSRQQLIGFGRMRLRLYVNK
jgi:hypothetical protein